MLMGKQLPLTKTREPAPWCQCCNRRFSPLCHTQSSESRMESPVQAGVSMQTNNKHTEEQYANAFHWRCIALGFVFKTVIRTLCSHLTLALQTPSEVLLLHALAGAFPAANEHTITAAGCQQRAANVSRKKRKHVAKKTAN